MKFQRTFLIAFDKPPRRLLPFFPILHSPPSRRRSHGQHRLRSRLQPQPLSVAYAASKAGVVSITKTAATVLAPRRIRVNAVCPGATATEMLARMADERGAISGNSAQEALQNFIGDIPLGRPGTPADVARVVAFLASDAASCIPARPSTSAAGGP